MTTSSRKPKDDHSNEIEQLVHEYLRRCGRMIPQTPDEVAAAEEWLSNQEIQITKSLQSLDGCALPKRLPSSRVLSIPTASSDIREGLARAAREGNAIPPEVEEQMNRDREQKEREAEGDK